MLDGYIDRFLVLIGAKQPEAAPETETKPEAAPVRPQAAPRPVARPSAPSSPTPVARSSSPAQSVPAEKPRAVGGQVAVTVSAKVSSGGGKHKPASPEVVERILSINWEVLTGPSAKVELSSSQSKYVALLTNPKDRQNTLIIADGFQMHPETSAAKSHLRRRGESWVHEFIVDLPVIRQVYQKAGFVTDRVSSGSAAQRGKEFLDLIRKSAEVGSSDMHLTVYEHEAMAERREDGELEAFEHLLSQQALEICQAAFAMTDNSDPTYMPLEDQEARVTRASVEAAGQKFPDGVQALRLQFTYLPPGGRYLVARLLYDQKVGVDADVDTLGFAKNHIRELNLMRSRPYGVNIISGPTGSGKSTTLQRILTALKRKYPGRNILSIEDPPEYLIERVRQLAITNARTEGERSAAYQKKMNSAMRLDPDTIMVGEVRDGPSASLMFKAAMSGHGVYTTVHANTAPAILDRLRDMGVEPYKLGDATLVTGLVGQRLLRRIKPEYGLTIEEARSLGLLEEEDFDYLVRLAGPHADKVRFDGAFGTTDPAKMKRARNGRSIIAEAIHPDQTYLDYYFEKTKSAAMQYWIEHMNGVTMYEHAMTIMCQGLLCPMEFRAKLGRLQMVDVDRREKVFKLIGV
ncbi:Flp pilus assembly complex ATPase component TadA [Agrobacterium rubi]|nr:Flp pilus assembly complex ATPase component TadA [Agrobacterium rubi]NTF24218.1 Flp pilus assembly complex ATPase component TadA [Agrobacterium rubi]